MIRFAKPVTFSTVLSSLALVGACSDRPVTPVTRANNQEPTVVKQLDTPVAPPEGVKPTAGDKTHRSAGAVVSEVTFDKAQILNRTFLYGSDLQYSAVGDKDLELTLQAMAVGHWPARFRIIGDRLQLSADQSSQFESDINHPERLIHEFQVVRQDDQTVTVAITRASPTLAPTLDNSKAPKERASWVRSVNYVAQGNYLMIESSIEAADGSIAEFMESVFPRETLVAGADKVIFADAELEPMAERFRFLDAGSFFLPVPGEGRIKTKAANRFNTKPGQTIDWYVTSNIPDQYLPEVRMGIEGWNRYFQSMWKQDGMRFKGKLPTDVKIGDPRFNVVNWDSVAQAGAAYESQASDPETGLQSHSLIYLPLAWVNIGADYWKNGGLSEAGETAAARVAKAIEGREILGRKLKVACLEDAAQKISIEAAQKPDEFARELLKGVLLHEVGHALGLAHNFKGSLSWNADDSKTAFTTSIMDYNQYHIERAAFESVSSEKGPLLEYDRQILSVLYNGGKDVAATDAVLPTCNDDEADSFDDGVDPLCIRYDSGTDPLKQLVKTRALIEDADARLGATTSLPKALERAQAVLGDASTVTDIEVATKTLSKVSTLSTGLVNFYVSSGAQSLNYMTRANLKSLYVFKQDALPSEFSEDEMQKTALAGFQYIASLETLPEATRAALAKIQAAAQAWLIATPAYVGLTADKQAKVLESVTKSFGSLTGSVEAGLLSRLRGRVLGSILRHEGSPFAMIRNAEGTVDYEKAVLEILEKGIASPLKSGQARPFAERASLVPALKSFESLAEGKEAIERVQAVLRGEASAATSARARDQIRELMKALAAPGAKE